VVFYDAAKAKYAIKSFTTRRTDPQEFPAGMAMLDRDNILGVTYASGTIRFYSLAGGIDNIKELMSWAVPGQSNLRRLGAAFNSAQAKYYLLMDTRLYHGTYGSWATHVGSVSWDYNSSDEESIALTYLGNNTFAALLLGSNESDDKFKYTIFTVDDAGDATVDANAKNVELTMTNPAESGTQIGPNFICAAPRRLETALTSKYYCWTSAVAN